MMKQRTVTFFHSWLIQDFYDKQWEWTFWLSSLYRSLSISLYIYYIYILHIYISILSILYLYILYIYYIYIYIVYIIFVYVIHIYILFMLYNIPFKSPYNIYIVVTTGTCMAGDLKGITFVMPAVHEQVALMSSS